MGVVVHGCGYMWVWLICGCVRVLSVIIKRSMSDFEQDSSSPDVKEKEEVYNEEEDLEKLINEVSQQYKHSPSAQSGDHVESSHDQENVFSPIESPEDNTTLPDGNETTEDNLHPLNNEEEESSRKRPLSQDEDEETEVQEKRPRIDKSTFGSTWILATLG